MGQAFVQKKFKLLLERTNDIVELRLAVVRNAYGRGVGLELLLLECRAGLVS